MAKITASHGRFSGLQIPCSALRADKTRGVRGALPRVLELISESGCDGWSNLQVGALCSLSPAAPKLPSSNDTAESY